MKSDAIVALFFAILSSAMSEVDLPKSQSHAFTDLAAQLRKDSEDSAQLVQKLSESVRNADFDLSLIHI